MKDDIVSLYNTHYENKIITCMQLFKFDRFLELCKQRPISFFVKLWGIPPQASCTNIVRTKGIYNLFL